jgi:transposase
MSNEVSYVKQLEAKISILEQENKNLHETVAFLSRKLFGKSSEKTSSVLGQVSLFDEAEVEADPDAPEPSLEGARSKEYLRFIYVGVQYACQLKESYEDL